MPTCRTLPMPLPSTADLLVSGGDHRIALDPATGRNKYGCEPLACASLVPFGSSTSSGISPAAFAVVDELRNRLAAGLAHQSAPALYRREMDRLRREFLALCGLGHTLDPGLVFSASGTDVHLLAARVAARVTGDEAGNGAPARPLVILAGEAESGSGVPAALAGQHFSTYNALGRVTIPGESLGHACASDTRNVPIRNADGSLRDADAVDAEIGALVSPAVHEGRHVLLVLIDVSKTGCIAPGIACVMALQRRWPSAVQVLVDACQFRIEPATIQAYLRCGFMVALTGSKFLTGPSFSGALLLPETVGRKLRQRGVPAELRIYSAREEWPQDWACAQALGSFANFGLLLRWQAAVHELRALRAVPASQVGGILRRFADAVRQRLDGDPALAALSVPVLDRAALGSPSGWDGIQTIHPFLLYRSAPHGGRVPLNRDETAGVYRRLQAPEPGTGAPPYQLGQPVDCGQQAGIPVSALRLCMSARLVVQAARGHDQEMRIIGQAMSCLDAAAALAHGCAPSASPATVLDAAMS
ncbi:hypothetical protein P3W85_22820 [Cupriavidus basilensis]|uniref:Uncharacterized protein n=1 Tax=Cupriavidus basilensis TaxID=68895 RepID=A0ABT6AT02_9BURK|nr:hypothetical protein [Cupriavidus basilensis]MDF3835759.1 hypothetical protein [Cupriavidus basilensis]